MSVVHLRRETSPLPESRPALWWVGGSPGPLTEALDRPPHRVDSPENLPLHGAELVCLEAPGPDGASAEQLARRVRERCGDPELVVVLSTVDAFRETALLEFGFALVLTADTEPALARARLRRVESSALARVRLRQADPTAQDGDDDAHGRRLMALSFASRLLTTVQDENETFQRLVDIVARELHSDRVSLMQLDRETGVLEMRCAVGIPKEVVRNARSRLGEGIAGTCAQLGKPLYVDDHARARAQSRSGDLADYVVDGQAFHNLPMSLTVPIKVKGEVVGVVNVTDRRGQEAYSREDIAFISALMGQAGHLLENTMLLRHLEDLKAFSEQVLNTLADPLAVVDDGLRLVSVNRRFQAQFGGQVGDWLWDRLPVEQSDRAALVEAMHGRRGRLEPIALKDHVYEPTVTPFTDGRGEGHHLLFLHDATLRRQMERRLVGAEKMASLGVLAAGLAHEINNPIAFVKSNLRHVTEYLDDTLAVVDGWHRAAEAVGAHPAFAAARRLEEERDLDFVRSDAAKVMRESIEGTERVERIVQGLRSFAHPHTETAREARPAELIEHAVLFTQGKWKYKLDLRKEVDDGVPTLYCLSGPLEQVFMNLIVNAAQAAKGWGRLDISVRARDAGVEFVFSDTCGGIPEAIRGRIFEPFFTTKDVGEGTGLGLSIAYNIVESHGGRIELEVEDGVGSRFTIWLPQGVDAKPIVAQQVSRFRI